MRFHQALCRNSLQAYLLIGGAKNEPVYEEGKIKMERSIALNVSRELERKVVDFLVSLPNINNKSGQQALIYRAGLDKQLQDQINFPGSPGQFVELLVPQLVRYGQLEDGRNALIAVLEAAKDYVGQDRRAYCDDLIRHLRQVPNREKQLDTSLHCPFVYGGPVSYDSFIGRRKELRTIVSRLINNGQSTAITGDPYVGKTSLLNYLSSQETRAKLYGNEADCWYFSNIDLQMLPGQFTQAQFWEHALNPLKRHIEQQTADSKLADHYAICVDNGFGNFTLECLFSHIKNLGQRFILVLDEFDALLHHAVLNSAEFYGGLRALASSPNSGLALIIASRTPLTQLNSFTQQFTQEFSPTGSPFFNIFTEVTLGALTEKAVNTLLALAGERFTASDKRTIQILAGKHPYLLQATATALWDAYEEQIIYSEELWRYVAKRLYNELNHFFYDTWSAWQPEMRKAFGAIALLHQASFFSDSKFDTTELAGEIHYLRPELTKLEEKGLIVADKRYSAGYRISAQILLTWLADEVLKACRTDQPFEAWLQEHRIEGAFLSNKEKQVFQKTVKGIGKVLGKGGTAVIEAFGKGIGSGLLKIGD